MINITYGGFYKIEAIKSDGSKRILADWFPNLILNSGLDRMFTGGWITGCAVGTGNSSPVATQTALDNLLAWSSTQQANTYGEYYTSEPYYGWRRLTYRFGVGAATGNLSEVGVGWGSTSMYSRALILDGNGDPTTITVLSDEILDVTYEIRQYIPLTDYTAQLVLNGVTHDYTIRATIGGLDDSYLMWAPNPAYRLYVTASWVSDVSGSSLIHAYHDTSLNPIGSRLPYENIASYNSDTVRSESSYTNGTFTRNGNISLLYTGYNHANGISLLLIGVSYQYQNYYSPAGAYQLYFSPAVMKTSSLQLDMTIQISLSRRT